MSTVVKTRQGEVRGSEASGVNTFKGIPYAAPPFGANRLRPPQPVEPWSGVRDALTYGPKTPQPPYPPQVALLLPPELTIPGEDCWVLPFGQHECCRTYETLPIGSIGCVIRFNTREAQKRKPE
jgi:carboxylesterase type B